MKYILLILALTFTSTSQAQTSGRGEFAPGMVVMFAGATCPSGWLKQDGSAISRTTYSRLFAVISTIYGSGNGSTTFNIPDTQGMFVRGVGSRTISSVTYTGVLAASQGDTMQGHRHGWAVAVIWGNGASGNPPTYVSGGVTGANSGSFTSSPWVIGDAITDGTNGTPRLGAETRPANVAMNYCIKF